VNTASPAQSPLDHWNPAVERRALRVTLLGTGAATPSQVVDNDHFVSELKLDTTAHWIEARTGIVQRRHASQQQRTSDLAVLAARQALERSGLAADEIDLIVVATSTPDYTMPSTACLVQSQLGAKHAIGLDVVNACAGFVYAFDVALRYVNTGVRRALVIGADLGSRLVDFQDRGTCIFFGDGAGAVVIGAGGPGRVLATHLRVEGDPAPLAVPVGGAMFMDGRAVWNFATRVLPETVRELCRKANVPIDAIKLLVPHQANTNILAAAARELGLPLARVAINIDRYGNTLAASIPLALDEALGQGLAAPGDVVALVGFGAGLAWGGVLWRL
jgi:3-oxoacyl-[acyl-carrier-protein] synthase III